MDAQLVALEVLRTVMVLVFLLAFVLAVRSINLSLVEVRASVALMAESLAKMIERVPSPAWFSEVERKIATLDPVRISQANERTVANAAALQELVLLASSAQRRIEDDEARIKALESPQIRRT